MTNADLLIVEDNIAEAIYAQGDAIKAGYKNLLVATDLETAQNYLPHADRVATDLFFPAGNVSVTDFSKRILPLYENFKKTNFSEKASGVVLASLEQCAELFSITPKEYVEKFMAKMNTPKSMMKAARDALAGINDSERYDKFLKIESDIREGKNLPLGILVSEQAKEKGLPTVIVTSTNHHDMAFDVVKTLITVPYFYSFNAGRKDWAGAMHYFTKNGRTD